MAAAAKTETEAAAARTAERAAAKLENKRRREEEAAATAAAARRREAAEAGQPLECIRPAVRCPGPWSPAFAASCRLLTDVPAWELAWGTIFSSRRRHTG
eukprot:COSAG02_NODE_37444_length_442_cov_0.390671_1_plen_100_part_00